MNNLILVRHGQSQWNKEKRFTGWVDIDLTKHGKSEAKYAGKLIKKLNIDFHICFTSKLKKTWWGWALPPYSPCCFHQQILPGLDVRHLPYRI